MTGAYVLIVMLRGLGRRLPACESVKHRSSCKTGSRLSTSARQGLKIS